jgi:Icc-related predicted phosphoesterase
MIDITVSILNSEERYMKSIRILAIAPYKGMEQLMKQIAGELENIDLQVFAGDLEEGVKHVRYEQDRDYDFIVSRGETARMIEQEAHIPIVEISLSEYDILHAIRIARGFSEKFCVAGSPDLIARIQTLCNLMELNIDTAVIGGAGETEDRIQELKNEGYTLIQGERI